MIKSFRCEYTRNIFHRNTSSKFPVAIQKNAYRKLVLLHSANGVIDLKSPPGNRLEKLKGDRKGQYSIRINNQWRICFSWKGNNAYDVEIVDYH